MQRAAIIFLLAAFVFAQDDVPPFLQGAPQNVIDEFRQIIATAPQHTDSEMEQLIQNWANRQTPQIAQGFEQYKQQLIAAEQEGQQQHEAALANLSPGARQADAQLTEIAQNPTMTGAQKQAAIQQLLNSIPASEKEELQKAFEG